MRFLHLGLLGCLALIAVPAHAEIRQEVLLEAERAWEGSEWTYLPAPPQVTLLRLHIPPYTTLGWHQHPMLNVAFVEHGSITVERRVDGLQQHFSQGEAVAEAMNVPHRGHTGPDGARLLVFYAGSPGVPLVIPDE
ncbi:cupin domain-containing protein [Stenotrophomonas forensis]|uniref:Cupin domain-containing protein n=1 Tax=Stenotrophomonas forensis TaxID=2871169 RepID=A0ABY7Y0R7_9GAMM|nr:cupin domain-containing protein [Stenotrophomonas sp. DFS-20110405]WDM63555.1 cupin domain-containing protein [Stenotrophomonas sp. DFS-20110405]